MINFVVVSSDLQPYVLDTPVKRGAELSTDRHLVVSWICWMGRKLDSLGRPKCIVRVCWEQSLVEPSVREVFNSHLRKGFHQIAREAGDIEAKCTGESLGRPWKRTNRRPRRNSGKPSGVLGRGSSPPPTLFTVEVEGC